MLLDVQNYKKQSIFANYTCIFQTIGNKILKIVYCFIGFLIYFLTNLLKKTYFLIPLYLLYARERNTRMRRKRLAKIQQKFGICKHIRQKMAFFVKMLREIVKMLRKRLNYSQNLPPPYWLGGAVLNPLEDTREILRTSEAASHGNLA